MKLFLLLLSILNFCFAQNSNLGSFEKSDYNTSQTKFELEGANPNLGSFSPSQSIRQPAHEAPIYDIADDYSQLGTFRD